MPSHYDDKHGGKSKVNKGAKPKKRKKPEHSKTKKARAEEIERSLRRRARLRKARAEDTERSLRGWARVRKAMDKDDAERGGRLSKETLHKIAIQSATSRNRRARTDDYYDGPDDAAARKDARRYSKLRAEELAALRAGRSLRKRKIDY